MVNYGTAKQRIYVVDTQPLENRYTKEWATSIPALLRKEIADRNLDIEVIPISGGNEEVEATPGAFLNFQAVNIYQNNQLNNIARRFGLEVRPGDKFLFTDAWNTCILQLKYMSGLLDIPIKIYGLFHSGSYDFADELGRKLRGQNWVSNTEMALFEAIDHNCFATNFHIEIFGKAYKDTVFVEDWMNNSLKSEKIIRTGWPMEYFPDLFSQYDKSKKEDMIIFPHRISLEKQPHIFRDLEKSLPEYKFVVCQDKKLTKREYHELLAKSKLVWSASQQETLGLVCAGEGPLLDAVPLMPNRLSYTEIFEDHSELLYPSEWTKNWAEYEIHKDEIITKIRHVMNNYNDYLDITKDYVNNKMNDYFTATNLINHLLQE